MRLLSNPGQTRSHLHSFRQRIHQARLLRIAGRQVLLINLGAVGPVETAVGPRCLTPAPTHPARTGCEVALTCHDLDGPRLSRPASAGASILAWLRLVVGRFSLPGALFNAILCCDRRGELGKGTLERAVRVARLLPGKDQELLGSVFRSDFRTWKEHLGNSQPVGRGRRRRWTSG